MLKPLLSSKTINFNTLVAILSAAAAIYNNPAVTKFLSAHPDYALYAGVLFGLTNIALRLVTKQPVDWSGLLAWVRSVPKPNPVPTTAVVDSQLPLESTRAGGWSSGALLLAALLGAGTGGYVAWTPIEPAPQPDPIDTLVGPSSPVVRGDPARFDLPDGVVDPKWLIVETPFNDITPPHDESNGGRTIHVSTATPGKYRAIAVGLLNGAAECWPGELIVANDGPPPAPPAPPKPIPDEPGPDPPQPATIEHGYFVLLDSWAARAENDGFRTLGPESKTWAAMRAAGHVVKNFDVGSEIAVKLYPTYVGEAPTLLIFDRDRADKFVTHRPVKSIDDVRKAYRELTGKDVP